MELQIYCNIEVWNINLPTPRSMLNIGHTHACTQSSQNDDVLVQYMVR